MKVNGSSRGKPERRTQAQRTAETRARLLAAGRRLFADHAFADVSTQQLVEAAGVTRGALYHQFEDKAALFAAVYEQVEEQLVAQVAEGIAAAAPTGQLDAMRHGVRLFLDLCAAPDVHRIVLVNAPAVLGWQRWREVGEKYGLGVIEAMLTQAVADGVLPPQPVRAAAHVLLGALDEAALYVSRAEDAAQARADMLAVCDRIIAGLAGQ
jgi:AcrR family transcriptional regulator